MFNMKQSKNIRNNSQHLIIASFCLTVFLDLFDLIFPLHFFPLKKLVKYSHFCINPIPYIIFSSGNALTFLFIIKKNFTPNKFTLHL